MEHYSVTLTQGWQCEYAILQTRLANDFGNGWNGPNHSVHIFLGDSLM